MWGCWRTQARKRRLARKPGVVFRPRLELLEDRVVPTTLDWSGAVDNSWSDPQNWQQNRVPLSTDDLGFSGGTALTHSTNDFSGAPQPINSITFTNTAVGYLVDGGGVQLSAGIVNNSPDSVSGNTLAFSTIALAADQSFNTAAPSGLTIISSDVSLNQNDLTLDAATQSASAINGVISGNGSITKQGNGLWVFGGTNTDFAQRIINNGAVALNDGLGLGSPTVGTIVNTGGSLLPNAPVGGGTITVPEPLTLNGAGSRDPGALAVESAGGNIIMTGPITLGSPTTIGSNVPGSSPITIQNTLSTNGFNLTTAGTAQLSIMGQVIGGGALVSQAAFVGGTGRINAPLQMDTGTLFPGVNGAPGLFTVGGAVLNPASSFQVVLNGKTAGAFSQLQVNGNTNLNGNTLNATINFTASPGDSFVIVNSSGPLTGTFAGLPGGAHLMINGQPFAITYTTNKPGQLALSSQVILVRLESPASVFVPIPAGMQAYATGADAGGGPDVKVYLALSDQPLFSFFAYDMNFTGGVRVAVGDVNGDGVVDIITAAGPGGGPNIAVLSGKDGSQLLNFFAYDPGFTGGVYVAAADVNGDGKADIVCGADRGGGPNITVFSGGDGSRLASFFAYDSRFTGGVRVGAGDINGDGKADIIAGAGPGGGPNVTIFDGSGTLLRSFFAYDPAFGAGIYVAGGDLNGDGKSEVIAGAGPGGGPNVTAFDVTGQLQIVLVSFFPYDPRFTGGVRVAAVDRNGDGKAEIVSVAGPGGGTDVGTFDGATGVRLDTFFAYNPAFTGGLYVAGTGH